MSRLFFLLQDLFLGQKTKIFLSGTKIMAEKCGNLADFE